MTPAPIQCPHCGSYDVEWLNDEEIKCLDCGRIFRCPPGLFRFVRRETDFEEDDNSNGNGETSWEDIRRILEQSGDE